MIVLRSRFGGRGALVFLHRRSFRRCSLLLFSLRAVASKAFSAAAVSVASACGVSATAFDSGSAFADTSPVPQSGRLTSLSFVIFILSGDGKSFREYGSLKMKKTAPNNRLL